MKSTLVFFVFCLVNYVRGDCDTHRFTTPNLKFLKILTDDTFQVRKSDRDVREGQEVYLYCSNKTLLSDKQILSKAICENTEFDRDLPKCLSSCEEPVFDASTTTIKCTSTDCNRRQNVGSKIEITCRPGFEFPKSNINVKQQITCLNSGWDNPLYSCGKYNDQNKEIFTFEDPLRNVQRNNCPGSQVVCGERCIAIEDLCTDKCKDIPRQDQCKFRGTHQMQITGLNLLKFIGNLDHFKPNIFPNWIVPTASLWSLFSFLSKASDRNISQQLQYDFGVTPDHNVNEDYRKMIDNAQIISSASYTNPEISKMLLEAHFRRIKEKVSVADWFYSEKEDRVTGIYEYNFDHSFEYRGNRIAFMTSETEAVKTVMICSDTDFKLLELKGLADVIDVAINATVRLMMFKPKDVRESLFDVINALKKWPIRDLLKLPKVRENDGVCFPRFKVYIATDYSPILFKMGYDYLFTPTRVNLEKINATNVRVQTQVRAFIKIWDADNDYGEETIPFEEDISSYFAVDQPFVFILYDKQTKLPWLVGRINNPKMIHYYTSKTKYNMFP